MKPAGHPDMPRFVPPLVLLLCCVPYLAALNGEPFYDDHHTFVENSFVVESHSILDYFRQPAAITGVDYNLFRPLTYLSYRLNHVMADGNLWPFHLTNILLHFLCALLIFYIAFELTSRLLDFPPAKSRVTALFTGALFALSPLSGQVVNYVADRAVLLCTFLMLASIYCLLIAPGRRRQWQAAALFLLAAGFYLFALGAKEAAITTPLFFLLIEVFVFRKESSRASLRYGFYSVAIVISAAYLALFLSFFKVFRVAPAGTVEGSFLSKGVYMQTQIVFFWRYLLDLLWVRPAFTINDYQPVETFTDPRFVISLLAVISVLTALVYLNRRLPILLFAAGWILMGLSLTSSLFPLLLFFNPNRIYLSSFGFFLALSAAVVHRIWDSPWTVRKWGLAGAFLLLAALGFFSFRQSMRWSRSLSLTLRVQAQAPASPTAAYYYAKTLIDHDQMPRAGLFLEKWLSEHPLETMPAYPRDTYKYMAQCYERYGLTIGGKNPAVAAIYFKKAISLWAFKDRLWINLAIAQGQAGRKKEALDSLRNAQRLVKNDPAMLEKIYQTRRALMALP